jgi:hypothetical protein
VRTIPATREILNSQMFADVLAEITERYDHVLVDSPPVMPVTDARILAASADATLLAVRGKTQRKAAIFTRCPARRRVCSASSSTTSRAQGAVATTTATPLYRYGYGVDAL